MAASRLAVLTSTGVAASAAFSSAARAAVLAASDVRVAPETESQPFTVSAVASLPSSSVLIPCESVYAHLKYFLLPVEYPFPGVTAISANLPSLTVRETSISYSSHSSSFVSSSAVLVT